MTTYNKRISVKCIYCCMKGFQKIVSYRQTLLINSISSLRKISNNEIKEPNNFKKVFEFVWRKKTEIINNLLRQAWTSGRHVSTIWQTQLLIFICFKDLDGRTECYKYEHRYQTLCVRVSKLEKKNTGAKLNKDVWFHYCTIF